MIRTINVTLIDNQTMTFWANKSVLTNVLGEFGMDSNSRIEDICQCLLSEGPWDITVSHFRRQIIRIIKPSFNQEFVANHFDETAK